MTAKGNRINKSEVVRQILYKIGAVSEHPPEGWHATVEEQLAKQKDSDGNPLKINPILIYKIRRTEIQKKPRNKKTSDSVVTKTSDSVVTKTSDSVVTKTSDSVVTKTININLDMKNLILVNNFAKNIGGIENLYAYSYLLLNLKINGV